MGMQIGFATDSGDAYWFADIDASVEWTYQRRDAPHDCALRLRAGETTFDPSWELDLTTRTGGVSAVASVSPTSNSDFTETTLTELTDAGVVQRAHVRGELRKIFRLR